MANGRQAAGQVERFTDINISDGGLFTGTRDGNVKFSARMDLFLISTAWNRGLDLEAEADGFGAGLGTQGDWSAIRDSSETATALMFQKALNFLFPERG